MHTLENELVKIVINSHRGGRVETFLDKKTGQDWAWHPDRYCPDSEKLPIGATFDSNWTGGWEDIFPNDMAQNVLGFDLADHGELWSQTWEIRHADSRSISLRYHCLTVPVRVSKSFTLESDGGLAIAYTLENDSNLEIPYLFKMHAALPIAPGDEILMPECAIEPVALGFSSILGRGIRTPFPFGYNQEGQIVSVNFIREEKVQEFVYATDLEGGWCGLRKAESNLALMFKFELGDFPFVWIFQSSGEFQGHNVLILEPCTTVPYDLEVAHQRGTCPTLAPFGVRNFGLNIRIEEAQVLKLVS